MAKGNKDITDNITDIVKTKRKCNNPNAYKNSPVIGNNGFMTDTGDNSNILKHSIEIAYRWPSIDTTDNQEVQERIIKYFEYCFNNDMKPGVEGMALALGIDRRTLWEWECKDKVSMPGRSDVIKKAKQILADYMENLSQNGKINPVTAIFLMKNHFGYADKQEVVLTPNQSLEASQNPDQIAAQIEADIPID